MKNKIIYLIIFIFSANLFSSAKKLNTCKKTPVCAKVIKQEENESTIAEPLNGIGTEVSSLGVFFFNI